MSEGFSLNATKRDSAGKGPARAARRADFIPAIIYGDKKPPVSVNLDGKTFRKLISQPGAMSQLIDLDVDGTPNDVLARDIQFHPVTDVPLHVDFLRVSKTSTVTVMIGVEFANEEESPGLKTGGVLNIVRHEVEISCPATEIPEKLVVDLTGANIGDSLHISAVALPEGATPTITDRDFTIATIAAPTVDTTPAETDETEIEDETETTEETKDDEE